MKEGWVKKKLGEVCEIIGGGTPKTNIEEFWGGTAFWITPAELKGDKWISCTSRTITEKGIKSAHLQLLPSGTVLLSSRAPIGKIAITTVPMYCNQGFKNLVCSNLIFNEFAYYYLLFINDYLNKLGKGATFKEISKTVVSNVEIEYPSLTEQQRIVKKLDAGFTRIEQIKANAEKNLRQAKDLFQSTLRKELSKENKWDIIKLNKLCSFSQGVQVPVNEQILDFKLGHNIRFLRIIDFTQGSEPPRYVSILDTKYRVSKDDISIVRYGASTGFICSGLEGVIANNLFRIIINNKEQILKRYLYYVLKSDIFQNVIRVAIKGVAMPAISFGIIKDIDIPFPKSLTEQQIIVDKLDKLSDICKKLEDNYNRILTECDALKQALLRKAFNGEL